MMKKSIGIILFAIILSGCSARAVLVHKKVNYDPTQEARVRVYNSNGNSTTKVRNETSCQDLAQDPRKKRSRNPFSRENMYIGLPKRTLSNVTIGIPATERSVSALKRDSYTDTDSFREQVITANKPVTIQAGFHFTNEGMNSTQSMSCRIIGEFIPQAGKDYEVGFSHSNEGCRLFIYELASLKVAREDGVQAERANEIKYQRCTLN
ncbi:hypothetical protein ACLSZ7_05050 [Avibacterium gallinarum]|uniref:hypothetical protein n=1 Tax=Avibacterium gallinarum TaxID=755 RepID=UPI003BF90883